jgi:hypothetical protein
MLGYSMRDADLPGCCSLDPWVLTKGLRCSVTGTEEMPVTWPSGIASPFVRRSACPFILLKINDGRERGIRLLLLRSFTCAVIALCNSMPDVMTLQMVTVLT